MLVFTTTVGPAHARPERDPAASTPCAPASAQCAQELVIAAAARRPEASAPEFTNTSEAAADHWQIDSAADRTSTPSLTDRVRTLLAHADIGHEDDTIPPNGRSDLVHSDGTTFWRSEVAPGMDLRKMLVSAGIPSPLAQRLWTAMGFAPDFPRRPRAGSHLTLAYETALQGRDLTAAPDLLYALLDDGRKSHQIFRYAAWSSMVAYVNQNGVGGAIISLQEPVPNARLTSGFGWRMHPILGVRKFHNGVDYAAPAGTPVHATGAGVIEEIGWHGQNGRYIRIRHGEHLVTTYSHLKRYATGLKQGARVRAGETIAFIGQSGLATGPHLYYEVIVDNKPVRPINMPIVVPIRLTDTELANFHQRIALLGPTTISGR
jgi:murein DD-endopeptidase MepM/ murein hydrolase activator NlpD